MHPHVMLTTLRNASRALHPQTHVKYSKQNLSILSLLASHGFVSSVTLGSSQNPHPLAFRDAPAPARILITNLKYRGDRSVIGKLELISKPSKRIVLDKDELARLVRGRRVKGVAGACLGEVFFVKTEDETYLEAREAVRLGLGGEVIVKVGAQ